MRLSFVFLAVVIAFIGGHFATPLIAPPQRGAADSPLEPRRIFTTYATLKVDVVEAPHVPNSVAGALAVLDDRLLLLTAEGAIHLLGRDRSGFDRLDLPLPLDRAAAKLLFGEDSAARTVGAEGLAVRPTAAGWELFVSHTGAHAEQGCVTLAVSRISLRAAGDGYAAEGSWRRIFETAPCLPVPGAFPFQSAGMLAFGPDGRLLLASGDHGYDDFHRSNPLAKAGEDTNDYGKLIAIDPDTGEAERIARGFRNASGLAVDDRGRIWQVEHGPMGGDELNLVVPGADYGWPRVTYGVHYWTQTWPLNPAQGRHADFRRPIFAWVPSIAVSGLIQLRGEAFPAWQGDLLAGALHGKKLVRLRLAQSPPRVILAETVNLGVRIRALAELPDGAIAVLVDDTPKLLIVSHDSVLEASGEAIPALADCTTCHPLTLRSPPGAAPTLHGVWQREIAALPGVDYSSGLEGRPGVWDRKTLAAFLADPQGFAPGTTMPSPGLGPEEIEKVIAALEGLD